MGDQQTARGGLGVVMSWGAKTAISGDPDSYTRLLFMICSVTAFLRVDGDGMLRRRARH